MKFTTNRETLLRPLQLVTGVVERRQTLPVLANLLVVARDGSLSLTGTDLEVELVAVQAPVDVQQEGEATIPARKLADIWRSLPEDAEVTVEVSGEQVRPGRREREALLGSKSGAIQEMVQEIQGRGATKVYVERLEGVLDDPRRYSPSERVSALDALDLLRGGAWLGGDSQAIQGAVQEVQAREKETDEHRCGLGFGGLGRLVKVVVPKVDDQELGLDPIRQPLGTGARGVVARATPDHLFELDLRLDRTHKD